MKSYSAFAVATSTLLAFAAFAGSEPEFALPQSRTAPVIDGCLGPDEWKDAAEFQRFVTIRSDVVFPGKAVFWARTRLQGVRL